MDRVEWFEVVVAERVCFARVHGVFTQLYFVILRGLGGLKKRCSESWFYGL